MTSLKKTSLLLGALYLFLFISQVFVYQVLQGPVLFSDNFLTDSAANSDNLLYSVLLQTLNGCVSLFIATKLYSFFKQKTPVIAMLFMLFTFLNVVQILIDNFAVLGLMEFSKISADLTDGDTLAQVFYQSHRWTHYVSLLISAIPSFFLYLAFLKNLTVPKLLAAAGILSSVLLFTELLASILGSSISMNLMLPMGLAQLALIFYLLIKGLKTEQQK
jgi:hypothetical protein